jgi:hypothetical protein
MVLLRKYYIYGAGHLYLIEIIVNNLHFMENHMHYARFIPYLLYLLMELSAS